MRQLSFAFALLGSLLVVGCLGPVGKYRSREGWIGAHLTVDERKNELRVANIIPGSPADQAGMKVGDVLEKWDGKPISLKHYDSENIAKDFGHLQECSVDLRRQGETMRLRVKPIPLVESRNFLIWQTRRIGDRKDWMINLALVIFGRGYPEKDATYFDVLPEHAIRAAYAALAMALKGLRGTDEQQTYSLGEWVTKLPTITRTREAHDSPEFLNISILMGTQASSEEIGGIYPLVMARGQEKAHTCWMLDPFISWRSTSEGKYFDLWPIFARYKSGGAGGWWTLFPIFTRVNQPGTKFYFWRPPTLFLWETTKSGKSHWRIFFIKVGRSEDEPLAAPS